MLQGGFKATYDPVSIADGTKLRTSHVVPDAQVGDFVKVIHKGLTTQNVEISGRVISGGVVRVTWENNSGGAVDIPSAELQIVTWRECILA